VNCTVVDSVGDSAMDDANNAMRVNVVAGSGSGTEYTEDDIAAANPSGPMPVLVANVTPGLEVADGDVVAQRATRYGAAYSQIVDSSGNLVDSFGGGTQYDEDTTHVTGDKVTMAGVVQQSSDAALSGDGDRSLMQVDASGFLKVNVKAGSAGGTEYTEDAAAPADPAGGAMIARRRDSPAVETTTDGDVTALNCTGEGSLHVELRSGTGETGTSGTPLRIDPTGSTTQPVSGTVTADAGTGPAAGALHVDGSAVTQPISAASLPLPTGAATSAGQLPDGHNVTVDNAAGGSAVNIQDGGNSITVDTTADATDGAAHGASQTGFRAMGTDGTNDQQIAVDATGNVQVDIVADAAGLATSAGQLPDGHNVTVDNTVGAPANVQISDGTDTALVSAAGALVVDGSAVTQPVSNAGLTELADAINTNQLDINVAGQDVNLSVTGVVAEGTAVGITAPVMGAMEARTDVATAVDSGDVKRPIVDRLGKQVVMPYCLPAEAWSYASSAAVTDTADDQVLAASAGEIHYITGVQVFNGDDTIGTEVVIKINGTVKWRGWAEQTGGGCSARFDPPLFGAANQDIDVANITTGASTYFNLQGFTATV
jgi:hypothetical protein